MLDAYTGKLRQIRDFETLAAGDRIIRWFTYLHFGSFGGIPIKTAWTLIGLAPAALFVTGFLVWWNAR